MSEISLKCDGISSPEISQIVRIHRTEIGQGFLSSLGNKGLELIFSNAIQSDAGLLVVAIDSDEKQICGFICGATQLGAFYKDFMRKKSMSAIIHLAPKLISPSRMWKALETLTFAAKRLDADVPSATLLDIAVSEEYHGIGVAQLLFHEFTRCLNDCGVTAFKIPTGIDQTRAHRFYEKLGARRVASIEVHKNQETRLYVFDIVDSN